jgi:hypothetical protein
MGMSETIYYPDDKPLTGNEWAAVWRDHDWKEKWRRLRAAKDELAHSRLDPLDLDDPVKLSEKYWDIWDA